jgi:toxin ParE1/3/4
MSLPLVFRRTARLELDETISWYENKQIGLGREFRIEVEEHLKTIASQPQRFRQIRGQVRRVVLKRFPFSIYFLPEVDQIVILAVFHARRAPQSLEGRFSTKD